MMKLTYTTALTLSCLFGSIAWGQAVPPADFNPGAQENLHRETLREGYRIQQRIQRQQPILPDVLVDTIQPDPKTLPEGADKKLFKLNQVVFSPNPQTVAVEEFNKIVAKYQEMEKVSYADLYNLLGEFDALFHEKGTVGCCILPPQDNVDQVLTIRVIEGKLEPSKITSRRQHLFLLDGKEEKKTTEEGQQEQSQLETVNRWLRPWLVTKNLGLKEGEILNLKTLQQNLERYNHVHSSKIYSDLAVGSTEETYNLNLNVIEPQPISVGAYTDNSGRKSTGRYRFGAYAQTNSLLGADETLLFTYDQTRGTEGFYLSGSIPLTPWDTTLTFSFDDSRSKTLYGDFKDLDITGHSRSFKLGIDQVIYADSAKAWHLFGDLRVARSWSWFDGYEQFSEVARIYTLGVSFDYQNQKGAWYASNSISYGNITNYEWDEFLFYRGNLTHVRWLDDKWTLVGRGSWQIDLSADHAPMASSQQFQIGGMSTVRGLPEGLMSGNNGYNVSGEARYLFYNANQWRAEVFTFADHGCIYVKEHGEFNDGIEYITSCGCGITANYDRYLTVTAGLALPLFKKTATAAYRDTYESYNIYFTIQLRY